MSCTKGSSVRGTAIVVVLGLMLGLVSILVGPRSVASASTTGALTVVEVGLEWPNLDPEEDTQEANDVNLMNAVYGELFTLTPSSGCAGGCKDPGQVVPSMARGYTVSPDGLTFSIRLRKGMTFQDGTAFNAQAVEFNIDRDISAQSPCLCKTNFSDVKSVTTAGPYTVQLHLSQRYTPLIYAFIDQAPNWIASPTAIRKMGEGSFEQRPVGAGPFTVVSNAASSQLQLKAFPKYFQKGHPEVGSLKFVSVGNDQSAISALQAGTAQVAVGVSSPQLIKAAQTTMQVAEIPATLVATAEFNTKVAPFNNLKARRAVALATDTPPIAQKLFPGMAETVQDQVGPGSPFFERKVPGYPSYDLAKAKALVQQLGGLTFTYTTVNLPVEVELAEVLQQQWQQAGMKVKINSVPLTEEVNNFESGNWQILFGAAGGADPDIGVQSIPSRYASNGTFTCCHDKKLDQLINDSLTAKTTSARKTSFHQVYAYIAKNVLGVDLYSNEGAVIAEKGVRGVTPAVAESPAATPLPWGDVSRG